VKVLYFAWMRERIGKPEEEIEPVQALALQDLQGLEDEPRHKVMIELCRLHYPPPLGQDRRGTEEGIASLNADVMRRHYQRLFTPRGTIVSVAGNIDWNALRDLPPIARKLFGLLENDRFEPGEAGEEWQAYWLGPAFFASVGSTCARERDTLVKNDIRLKR